SERFRQFFASLARPPLGREQDCHRGVDIGLVHSSAFRACNGRPKESHVEGALLQYLLEAHERHPERCFLASRGNLESTLKAPEGIFEVFGVTARRNGLCSMHELAGSHVLPSDPVMPPQEARERDGNSDQPRYCEW